MNKLKDIVDGHKFFFHHSQHYVMGNWNEYEDWFFKWDEEKGIYGYNFTKLRYTLGFIPAYLRFMRLTVLNK